MKKYYKFNTYQWLKLFTISQHLMTGPLIEPSIIKTNYQKLSTDDKPNIIDASYKFIMNKRSLMKHKTMCKKSNSVMRALLLIHHIHKLYYLTIT